MSSQYSVHDLLADRTETLDDKSIEEFFVTEKDVYLSRLLDDQPYLIVGSRGLGKSMLLRYAELIADKEFETKKILCVYVTFENSLVMDRMQAIREDGYFDPFRQWTFAKILKDLINKSEKLELVTSEDELVEEFFGKISLSTMAKALNKYIGILENKNIINASELRTASEKILSNEIGQENTSMLLDALENANATKQLLQQVIDDNNLQRIVLLFDEAAHALVPAQQEHFFTIFKSLRAESITCKAAVYPAVTHYGKDFDPVHDASKLTIDRYENDEDYIPFFIKLLQKRIPVQSDLWKKLTSDPSILPSLCYSCFGNPRFLFHLIDIFDAQQPGSPSALVQKVCKKFVQNELWAFHHNTGARSKTFGKAAQLGHKFIVTSVVPALVDNNNSWREKAKPELSIYFTVSSDIHEDLRPILDMLSYSGIIGQRGVLKTGQKTSGYLYALNISVCIDESVLKSDKKTDNSYVKEISLLQRERFRQYTNNNPGIVELINELSEHAGILCSNCGEKLKQGWILCPKCGTPVTREKSLYFELVGHPIDKLFLSERLKKRIREHEGKQFKTVGDILDAKPEEIDNIYYVGPVRVKMIKGSAEEYVAA